MAGGGTGGHVVPSLAVARELRHRGHEALFIGTRRGLEATLVPRAGFPIEWIETGGLQRVGAARALRALFQLPAGVARCFRLLGRHRARAVFSMGGYVAGPVMLAALLRRLPLVLMEPNAMPGLANRTLGRFARRALLSFEEARRYFPPEIAELAGLPVNAAFFDVPWRRPGEPFQVLVTGGSRGARALNRAVRECWPLLAASGEAVNITLQCGVAEFEELAAAHAASGAPGRGVPFIEHMAAAHAAADLVVSRAGAGAVAELAASGRPSILVPFPFAADDHQTRNAEALERAGAALLAPESGFDGARLLAWIREFKQQPEWLERMSRAARSLARRGAAERAAGLLVELAAR
jgi:UDP-N-acetylglucosamine--N-acetylmuramyl-(pentapeptide) pyrophosphoryl-undecaprenol N-acetylglucosamine transferase